MRHPFHSLQIGRDVEAEKLINELNSARIVAPEDVPSDVVTMNSIVKLSFLNNNKQIQLQIVYPYQANVKENKISILSPIATALIDLVHDNFIRNDNFIHCDQLFILIRFFPKYTRLA